MKFFSYLFISSLLLTGVSVAHADIVSDQGKAEFASIAQLVQDMDGRYPVNSIQTNEVADAVIAESETLQRRLQTWYQTAERHCYDIFFVNDCLQDIKVQRRRYLPTLQRMSIEAKAVQRQIRVIEKDREQARKQVD